MIRLHRLEGFYWVARTGGYSRAARAFPHGITQSAVHQQVSKLEKELGLTLFERVSRERLVLTEAGRTLHTFCRPFFEGLPAVVRSLAAGGGGGELSIRAQGLMLRQLLPEWLVRLRKMRPALYVHLTESADFDLTPLRRGETDLMVGHYPGVPDDVAVQPVATLFPFVALPREHRLARRKRLDLRTLSGDRFIGYPAGHLGHALQQRALAEMHIRPAGVIAASTADAILGFVAAGLGFTLIPSANPAGPRGKGFVVRRLDLPAYRFPVHVLWRREMPANAAVDAALLAAPKPPPT